MNTIGAIIGRFLRDEQGPTATEYAVMLFLVILACIAAITTMGTTVSAAFDDAAEIFPA